MNDITSGSDSREARTLDDPVMGFELDGEVARLRQEPGYAEFGRSSKTLGKSRNFRLVVTAARAGTDLGDDDTEAAMAIQVLDGTITVGRSGAGMRFGPGAAIWVAEGEGWAVRVEEDAALVLSIGWPGGRAEDH